MTFVCKNLTDSTLTLDGVAFEPGEEVDETALSPEMIAARNAGTLQVHEMWHVPVVSRVTGETHVVDLPAVTVALAMLDYHAGVDRGWAGYISVLQSARKTRL
jgi:hypothetical protein